jgi:hypothetical protein
MSREIPQDRPLSAEDRKYLLDRGREGLIERIDEEQGVEDGSDEESDEGLADWTDPSWTVAQLVAEINDRNVRRQDAGLEPLSTKGTKAELAQRLTEDDAE